MKDCELVNKRAALDVVLLEMAFGKYGFFFTCVCFFSGVLLNSASHHDSPGGDAESIRSPVLIPSC